MLSSNHFRGWFIAVSERSRPSKHDAENRKSRFEIVWIWGLVKNSVFWLQDCFFFFLSFFFLPTFSYSNFSPLLLTLGQWNLVCSFLKPIPRDNFFRFSNFSKLFEISRFFWLHNFGENCSQLFSGIFISGQWNLACSFPISFPGYIYFVFTKFSNVYEI